MAAVSVREDEVALATGTIKLLRGGSADAAKLMLLHHSWGSPGWLPVHELLAEHYEVLLPDLPGYGGSERPAWAREPRDLALVLSHCADAMGLDELTLAGFGFGGFLAAEWAACNHSRLSRLVLVGAAGLQPEEGEILDQIMVSHEDYVRAAFSSPQHFDEIIGAPSKELTTLWDHAREMTARVTWKPYMFSRRLAPLLGNVSLPTAIIWGSEDRVVPRVCAQQYADALPNATVDIVDGAGHLVEMEQPERVATLIGSG